MNTALAALLAFAIVLIECLTGGTRLVYSLPVYGLIGLGAIATAFYKPRGTSRPRLECLIVTILFFAYILTRAALSPVGYLWWTDFYMVMACLAVYFLTAFYLTDSRSRLIVLVPLLALVIMEVLFGLRQFRGGDNWMPFGFLKGGILTRRASGTLISPIHLAGYLEAVAVFALSFALWSNWKAWARILSGYIAVFAWVGVAITGSRGGYLSVLGSLAAFAALSLYTVRQLRPARFPLALIATVAVAVLGIAGGVTAMNSSPMLRNRMELLSQQFDPNGRKDVRIYNWQAALDQFRVSPVWGTGAGSHLYYGRFFRRPQIQADPIHAHSDYLEMLAEYGIVGLVGITIFIFVHANSGLRGFHWIVTRELREVSAWEPVGSPSLAIYIGALSAIAAYLVHSVMDFNLHIPGHALFFAFIFGIVAHPPLPATGGVVGRITPLLRWAVPAFGVWIAVSAVPKFPGEYWAEKTRAAVRDGKYREALEYGQKALSYERGNPEFYFQLGGANRGIALSTRSAGAKRPYLEAAVVAYQNGLNIFPQDSHALVRLGQALDDLGRFKEASEIFRKAVEYDSNLSEVYLYYAKHLATIGRQEEAEEQYETAKRLAQKDLSPMIRGTMLDPEVQNEVQHQQSP